MAHLANVGGADGDGVELVEVGAAHQVLLGRAHRQALYHLVLRLTRVGAIRVLWNSDLTVLLEEIFVVSFLKQLYKARSTRARKTLGVGHNGGDLGRSQVGRRLFTQIA